MTAGPETTTRPAPTGPAATGPAATLGWRGALAQIGRYTFVSLVLGFFALPLLWLATAPFDRTPTITTSLPEFTLDNFRALLDNPYALRSLWNSILLSGGTAVLVVTFAASAAYALSRVRMPGRDALLYGLLLLSSIVTGTATMVPLYELAFRLNLIDSRLGVILILSGGLLPAAIFILKDFMDGTPTSYEESARVFGASPVQIVWQIVLPMVRPGLATVAVWAVANVWGNFLVPFLLLRNPDKAPAAVIMYTLYTEGGQANLALLSTFSLLYSLPVVLMFVFVSSRYGFRFHGGIKR
ncbi:carbohydrate ABC transporter permease [Plantactinospora sp. BB1]|uniref:carbohydrate ABC transporter permease n=1 Tax=Plantactinospora sp. BB1 TaxID=2071627 RepID=UPI000D16EDF0|nr:carbohydrate ABC transporter permease [Plantactinospora sp. BB1]AVT35298.1 ABC transporter permease [Plantactinospora sp. BB1]